MNPLYIVRRLFLSILRPFIFMLIGTAAIAGPMIIGGLVVKGKIIFLNPPGATAVPDDNNNARRARCQWENYFSLAQLQNNNKISSNKHLRLLLLF